MNTTLSYNVSPCLNFTLKFKFLTFFSMLVVLSGNNIPLSSSEEISSEYSSVEINKEITSYGVNTDYLKKLPANDYIVGPGDSLRIIISRDYPELDSTVTIDGEGTIYLPKLNRIFVSGLTLSELNSVLNDAYKEFVKYPVLEVEVNSYRPIRVLVEGEVENPGLQTLPGSFKVNSQVNDSNKVDLMYNLSLKSSNQENIVTSRPSDSTATKNSFNYYFPTVFDAIRESGGITPFSDLTTVQVIRNDNLSNGGGKISTTINFQEVIKSGDSSQNIRIYDSDIIRVSKSSNQNDLILRKAVLSNLNPKYIEVFITGRVKQPGLTVTSKASVLTDAIDMAGGTKALKGKITFIRFNNDGTIDKRKFRFNKRKKRGSYENPILKNGDLVVVGESFITLSNEIIEEVSAPFVGIFSSYGLFRAISN